MVARVRLSNGRRDVVGDVRRDVNRFDHPAWEKSKRDSITGTSS